MKLNTLFLFVAVSTLCACSCRHSCKVEPATPKEVADAWHKAGTPGEEHLRLSPLVGTWKAQVKFWVQPDAEPEVSTGTAEFRWVLGGRFLHEDYRGAVMGRPFQGLGLIGYDNLRNRYISMWTDSTSTGLMNSDGTYDPATNTLSMSGDYIDPISKQKRSTRSVTSIQSDGSHRFEMFDKAPDGKEFKSLEIIYSR